MKTSFTISIKDLVVNPDNGVLTIGEASINTSGDYTAEEQERVINAGLEIFQTFKSKTDTIQ